MSGKRSTLRRAASASGPSPMISVRSGGTMFRHAILTILRRISAEPAAISQIQIALATVIDAPGMTVSRAPIAAVPVSAHIKMPGTSSTVRCRSERWSRS